MELVSFRVWNSKGSNNPSCYVSHSLSEFPWGAEQRPDSLETSTRTSTAFDVPRFFAVDRMFTSEYHFGVDYWRNLGMIQHIFIFFCGETFFGERSIIDFPQFFQKLSGMCFKRPWSQKRDKKTEDSHVVPLRLRKTRMDWDQRSGPLSSELVQWGDSQRSKISFWKFCLKVFRCKKSLRFPGISQLRSQALIGWTFVLSATWTGVLWWWVSGETFNVVLLESSRQLNHVKLLSSSLFCFYIHVPYPSLNYWYF